MTTWWELGLAVFGWSLLCFGLFSLGRWWERDHPKRWVLEVDEVVSYNGLDAIHPRRGPYDQENDEWYDASGPVSPPEIFYGPHRRG